MDYVICLERDSRKVPLDVCLKNCERQFQCNNFNELMFKMKGEQTAEKEEVESKTPEVQKESDDTDVRQEIIERPPVIPSDGKAQQLYQQVLSLKAEIEVRWFELGKILQEIFEGRHYIDLGYTTWKDFCEIALSPLEIRWRTADYLRMTVMKCQDVGIKKEVAGKIGWTKLKETMPVLTKENKDYWIEECKRKGATTTVINTKVRLALGKITKEEAEKISSKLFFSLYDDQLENVERTLELAGRMTGSNSRGYQLEMVCAEFRGTYESEDGEFLKKKIVSDLLGRIEAVMRVKFEVEVVDLETGEIILKIQ